LYDSLLHMKKVKYNGAPVTLGRFGQVSTGEVLDMGYAEYISVRGDSNFTVLKDPDAKVISEEAVIPIGGKAYDLGTLPWGETKIVNLLRSKNRRTIDLIIEAMAEKGVVVEVDKHMPRATIVDKLLFAADAQGWI